jgi:hypothetical protein
VQREPRRAACEGSDLELVVFTAAPGSSSAQALELLGAIGLQRFDVPAT